jgi:plastocyanin
MLCGIPDSTGKPHFQSGMIRPLRVGAAAEVAAEQPEDDTVVKATDFAFGLESSMTAGDHVVKFQNAGNQDHEATLFKLNEGATTKDVLAAFAPGGSGKPPAMPMGGVAPLAKGADQYFPVTLEPGRYTYICFLTDPATQKMHAELGMTAEFTVQ